MCMLVLLFHAIRLFSNALIFLLNVLCFTYVCFIHICLLVSLFLHLSLLSVLPVYQCSWIYEILAMLSTASFLASTVFADVA